MITTATQKITVEPIEIKTRAMPKWQAGFHKDQRFHSSLGYRAENAIKLELLNSQDDFKAFVFSDNHLSIPSNFLNSEYRKVTINGKEIELEAGIDVTRFPVSLVLKYLNEKLANTEKPDLLVFAGDTFEILGSCFQAGFKPYNVEGKFKHIDEHRQVFQKILDENKVFFDQLKIFLQANPQAKVIFNIGNHDHLLAIDGQLRDMLSKRLGIRSSKDQRIAFTNIAMMPDLKFYVEHGHLVEAQSHSKVGGATMCDALTLAAETIPRAVIKKIEELEDDAKKDINLYTEVLDKAGETENLLTKFTKALKILKSRIENFVFLDKVPALKVYLDDCFTKTAEDLKSKTEIFNNYHKKLLNLLQGEIFSKFGEIFAEHGVIDFFVPIAKKSMPFVKWIASLFLNSRKLFKEKLNKIEFQERFITEVNQKRKKKANNQIQINESLQLKKLFPFLKFFSFGHTHNKTSTVSGDEYATEEGTINFFNTGQGTRKIEATQTGDKWKFEQKHHDGSVLILSKKGSNLHGEAIGYDQLLARAV